MDMEALLPIIVQAITGVIGGQAVGAALKQAAMGQLPKILGGAVGGVGGAARSSAACSAADDRSGSGRRQLAVGRRDCSAMRSAASAAARS